MAVYQSIVARQIIPLNSLLTFEKWLNTCVILYTSNSIITRTLVNWVSSGALFLLITHCTFSHDSYIPESLSAVPVLKAVVLVSWMASVHCV